MQTQPSFEAAITTSNQALCANLTQLGSSDMVLHMSHWKQKYSKALDTNQCDGIAGLTADIACFQ